MQLYIFGTLLALAIGPAAATDGLDFEIFFTAGGGIAPEHCTSATFQGLNVTVTENGCESWKQVFGDAVQLVPGQTIPASLQTNDEQTCTVYWVREYDTGTTPQSCTATVLATTADLTDECYAAPEWTYGLNIVCKSN
ncbi:hypothetical protein GGI43DRAFT_375556 [Trichoderma evansii]